MEKIEVLLLANSLKLGGRCLAGLRTDNWSWVRPVSGARHGEILKKECDVVDGVLSPLDLISCDVTAPTPIPHQQENWKTTPGSIRLISHVPFERAEKKLLEQSRQTPYFLESKSPEIHPSTFAAPAPPKPSLALIRVESASIDETQRTAQRTARHITFTYRNLDWRLSLTDENFPVSAITGTIGPAYLCVSVGEYYQKMDAHYKLVAGIIPIPDKSRDVLRKGDVGPIAELCLKLFGSEPALRVPRFSREGWFYQGPVTVKCSKCENSSCHSFRSHYLNCGNVAHFWAIICETCNTAGEPADFDYAFQTSFKEAADLETSPESVCDVCQRRAN